MYKRGKTKITAAFGFSLILFLSLVGRWTRTSEAARQSFFVGYCELNWFALVFSVPANTCQTEKILPTGHSVWHSTSRVFYGLTNFFFAGLLWWKLLCHSRVSLLSPLANILCRTEFSEPMGHQIDIDASQVSCVRFCLSPLANILCRTEFLKPGGHQIDTDAS